MRCLLLALSVALACGAPSIFVPQTGENVDVQKVVGTWYPIAMVASDIALLNTESAPLRLYVKELKPTAQGGLEVTVRRWGDGSCVETKMLAEKTDVPASFRISNLKDGNVVPIPELAEGKVHLLDTDYKNFMFLCTEAAASVASAASAKQILACQYLGGRLAPAFLSQRGRPQGPVGRGWWKSAAVAGR
ncbi:glycodelin [Pteronotus mesoamericanus]|uniref:glycodelin n=1 Tax=Pteronotus mesoamericanus TaxID=1884717 RepID=UPI0023EC3621|nr:glycodelin [Pteronotus parnellii mesoamericanus]